MSNFFIARPIFAWVVAIFIMLGGVLALPNLPIAQYPNIAPPKISVTTSYPGASSEEIYQGVTRLIEDQLNGMPNDIYFKVGLIAIIGLSAKNAILIVEFAKELCEEGKSLREAAVEAATLRFRLIIMTSLAFMLGVTPLAIATGASAGSQNAIGTGLLGGMISAMLLAIMFVPVFYVFVLRWLPSKKKQTSAEQKLTSEPAGT